jgi:hypothetical protein
MIIGFKEPDKLLYHYTKLCNAQSILKDRKLRIGSYTKTNDPKEVKRWEFDLWSPGYNRLLLDKYRMYELSVKLSDELKTKTKVLCFSRDREPLTGDHSRFVSPGILETSDVGAVFTKAYRRLSGF